MWKKLSHQCQTFEMQNSNGVSCSPPAIPCWVLWHTICKQKRTSLNMLRRRRRASLNMLFNSILPAKSRAPLGPEKQNTHQKQKAGVRPFWGLLGSELISVSVGILHFHSKIWTFSISWLFCTVENATLREPKKRIYNLMAPNSNESPCQEFSDKLQWQLCRT